MLDDQPQIWKAVSLMNNQVVDYSRNKRILVIWTHEATWIELIWIRPITRIVVFNKISEWVLEST
jgi:hypothetical protein